MKTRKLLATLLVGMTLAGAVPTFALTTVQDTEIDRKHDVVISNMLKEFKLPEGEHGFTVKVVDKYGNILNTSTKYYGAGTSRGMYLNKQHVMTDTATRPGYKPVKLNVGNDLTKPLVNHTVTMEVDTVKNVVMGKVVFPEGTDTNGWYIQALPTQAQLGMDFITANSYIKVNADGTFKMQNLEDGDYYFQVMKLDEEFAIAESTGRTVIREFKSTDAFMWEKVTIKGNLNKTFDLSKQKSIGAYTEKDTFNVIDRKNLAALTEIYPNIELSKELKARVDKEVKGRGKYTTLSTLQQILNITNNTFPKTKNDSMYATRILYSVAEIEEAKNIDNCLEYALLFTAIARYCGIATVQVDTVSVNWMSNPKDNRVLSHAYVEVHMDGRWILVDPTNGAFVAPLDKDEHTIKAKDGNYMYVYNKMNAPHGAHLESASGNWLMRDLKANFDMSLVNKGTQMIIK